MVSRKVLSALLGIALLFGLTFTLAAGAAEEGAASAGGIDEIQLGGPGYPAFADIDFPDQMPTIPPMAEDGWYAYDNMDTTYTVEILQHHYGEPALPNDEDPIVLWLEDKFNLDIKWTTILHTDRETVITTRFAAGDVPDVFDAYTRDVAFTLSLSDLLVDARNIYPLMPQTVKFVTKNMIKWSTNPANDAIPFTTKYGIQDGVWGFGIREDWLAKFGMEPPTSMEEVLAYAKACVEQDPNGTGKDDTYFMTGAGSGQGWGMLGGWLSMFGNPTAHVEGGQLVHPMFDDTTKDYLTFLNTLYNMNVLAPDWYTIEWNKAKSYTMNDRLGMVWYPVGALYAEYASGAKQKSMESLDVWHWWHEPPIEGGKYGAAGNPGYLWGFSKAKFQDAGKLMRVAHMIDTMTYGGENFFQSIQGSIPEVFHAAGIETKGQREMIYTETNNMFIRNDAEWDDWMAEAGYLMKIAPWQHWGLCVNWQLSDPDNPDPYLKAYAARTNKFIQVVNGYERWPNDALLITLDEAATEATTRMRDWENAQQLSFVTGERGFDEWGAYQAEWLDKGGRAIVESTAKSFGVSVPSWAN